MNHPRNQTPNTPTLTEIKQAAEKFARHFLMPTKWFKHEFKRRFRTIPLILNKKTISSISPGSVNTFRTKYKTKMEICIYIANCTACHKRKFISLAVYFCVKPEAVADRLVELGWVKFEEDK